MPFKFTTSGIEFVKLPWNHALYGTEKGEEGKRYIYLRKFDFSGIKTDTLGGFSSSAWDALTSGAENDWLIPIKTFHDCDMGSLSRSAEGRGVRKLIETDPSSRPWLSLIETPNGSLYLSKKRFSASTAIQVTGLAAALMNPVTAVGAFGAAQMFRYKQQFKHGMAQSRGEKDPSWLPKVFVHKIWQVSQAGDTDEAYKNIGRLLNTDQVWTSWSD